MNNLGVKAHARYRLKMRSVPLPPQGFLRKKGAMGDDQLYIGINRLNLDYDGHPLAHPTAVGIAFPPSKGDFYRI